MFAYQIIFFSRYFGTKSNGQNIKNECIKIKLKTLTLTA